MKYLKARFFKVFILSLSIFVLQACGGGGSKVTIIPVSENFSEGETFNLKLDILWVVDPSRSMYEESERVRANISTFMEDIITSGYEYRVGVVSSAAWSDLAYQADPAKSFLVDSGSKSVFNRLHKGECVDYAASSGNESYLSYLNTLNLGAFLTNFNRNFDIYGAAINTSGCGLVGPPFGNYDSVANNIFADPQFDSNQRSQIWEYANDERPLQSMRTFLSSTEGAAFIRPDAFLAVILITDEPDGSRDDLNPSLTFDQSTNLGHTASVYTDYLNTLKGSTASYNVYSIIKSDGSNSLNELVATGSGGTVTDIDGTTEDYRDGLESIKNAILKDSSLYPLATEPKPETITISFVKTNGEKVSVPVDSGSGGFTYVPASNAIQFASPFIPDSGDSVTINFDPVSLGGSGGNNQPRISLDNNEVLENATNGVRVGFVSVLNSGTATITYSLLSDSSGGAFLLNSSTGELTMVDNSLLDSESQALHSLNIQAVSSDIGTIDKDVTVVVTDVVDSVPVAANDTYTVSETIADSSGDIRVLGNVSYNDTQIDISEAHTWASTNTPAEGTLTLNASGSFEYVVSQAALSLGSGASHIENLTYNITDASTNVSNTATITITIEGSNETPVNYNPIADQTVNIIGGIQAISLDDASFVSSGLASGSAADATDANGGTSLTTSAGAGAAHFAQYSFSSSALYEVTSVEIDGVESMGNTILQVISDTDQVLTREVADINQGSSIVVPFSTAAIGQKIKVIRPSGAVNSNDDDDLQLAEVRAFGYEAVKLTIDLNNHFSDADIGDTLTFYVTDKFGEGPAPGWVQVSGSILTAVPPAGADLDIGVLAEDGIGSTAFDVFNITRTGGNTINSAPLALLSIDDAQRGGLTLKRYAGYPSSNPNTDSIQWDEADEFLDQAIDANGDLVYPGYPGGFDGENHHGPGEDGWNPAVTLTNNKFAQSGRLIPLVDSQREYGEAYTGFFAPAKTGIYRFRTTAVDDVVRLLVSPSEYVSDLQRVISGTINTSSMRSIMVDSLVYADPVGLNITTTSSSTDTEFFPVSWGGGHDTSRFFQGGILGYQQGYIYLTEGNLYAYQVRFMEGGGSVAFNFEFDYKSDSVGVWEGWRPVDASTLVPKDGADAYTERSIPAMGSVNYDASSLFYDAEQDILEYSAKLVLPDGSDFVGPGSTSDLVEIGLNINTSTGLITGALNATYTGAGTKPRVQVTSTEKFTADNKAATALAIKLDPATAP